MDRKFINSAIYNAVVRLLLGVIWLCPVGVATASPVSLPSTGHTVKIDGILDDAVWVDAVEIELEFENNPGENLPARVRTTAYLAEDGSNLLVAFKADDPDPSKIRAYLRDRDSAYNDDFVGIVIDTYNDSRRAFEFFVNPLGVQMDMTNNETATGNQKKEDDSWDAIWESAGQINDEGFVVEMRIPLTQLRFPVTDGTLTWGLDLTRTYPRDRRYRFSNNRTERGNNCYLCQLGKLSGLEGATPGRDFEIVPTLTASKSESSDDPGIEPLISGGTKTDAGLSLRWGMTPDVTANLAINPDFSQVESDAAQLDVNNRFALFFPEKRPFFLEGADYFETPINAVFTRTLASPDVGAKITGKRGDHTFGLIAAQDAVTNLLIPYQYGSDATTLEQSNTALIGRYSRAFANTSSVGVLLTARDGDGYQNAVGGLDARWRLSDKHTITAQHLLSTTLYPDELAIEFDQPLDQFDGSASIARYDFDSRNFSGVLRYARLSNGYRSDSGFLRRSGVYRQSAESSYTWHGDVDDWWSRMRLRVDYDILHEDDHSFAERELSVRFGVGGPMQSWTQIKFETGAEQDDGAVFGLSSLSLYSELKPWGGLALNFYVERGDRIDYANNRLGDRFYTEQSISWNVSQKLALRIKSFFSDLDTETGEDIFDASVVDARATWQFSIRSFLRLTVQHADTERNQAIYIDSVDARSTDVGRQLLYSYKINPQTVFFLGYSDEYIEDDGLDGLTAADRSIFMKIGYAWNL